MKFFLWGGYFFDSHCISNYAGFVATTVVSIEYDGDGDIDVTEWLLEAYRTQWLAMLQVDNGNDMGCVDCFAANLSFDAHCTCT